MTSKVIDAPYSSLTLALARTALAALLWELPPTAVGRSSKKALAVCAEGPDVLDPISRLVRLLDHPG